MGLEQERSRKSELRLAFSTKLVVDKYVLAKGPHLAARLGPVARTYLSTTNFVLNAKRSSLLLYMLLIMNFVNENCCTFNDV